jgi:multidrug efflux system outer membrane protein
MGKVLCFLCLLILSACNRKHIQLPEATAPLSANENFSLARESNSTEMPTFQSLMEIPGLERVIRDGFTHNPRWKSQLAQLEEVRARYGLAKSDSLPSFNAKVALQKGRENTRESGFSEESTPDLTGGAMFNWEIDLWGKWRSVKKSASMHIREAEFLQKAAEISFSHEIAQAWISLAAQKEQVEIIAQSIARQRKALQLYKSMVNTGGEENATLARENLAYRRLLIKQAKQKRLYEVNKVRLQSLTGSPLHSNLPELLSISEIKLPQLPNVFPTIALKGRPDLLAKEAKLRENLYLEKSKEYDLYPSLSFQASGLSLGTNLSEPFKQWKASMGPVLNLPLWSPRKKSDLRYTMAKSEVYKQQWKVSINLAIEEIEVATKSFIMGQNELSLANRAHQESLKILSISKEKFKAGLLSSLELWMDEQKAWETESQLISTRLQLFQFALELSKSLGLKIKMA